MFVMMMPMIQTHAAPTDVIENNESGIPDRTLYQNILKVLGKQSTDTFTEQEASSVEELGVSENRLTDIKEIKNTLEFFGVDKEDEGNQKRLRDLENGQCLFQDLYGRVGVIQIHPVFSDLFHAFDTRPPVQTEETR